MILIDQKFGCNERNQSRSQVNIKILLNGHKIFSVTFFAITYEKILINIFSEKRSIEGEQEISCNICQKRFLSVVDLKKHNKNHLFTCTECNQAFNDQITLTKHSEEVSLKFK